MAGSKNYDVVVVGSGPNGLAAAITMQQVGLSVLLIEGKSEIGGGVRTALFFYLSFNSRISIFQQTAPKGFRSRIHMAKYCGGAPFYKRHLSYIPGFGGIHSACIKRR